MTMNKTLVISLCLLTLLSWSDVDAKAAEAEQASVPLPSEDSLDTPAAKARLDYAVTQILKELPK